MRSRDPTQGFTDIAGLVDVCGIRRWTHQYEIVVHDVPTVDAITGGDKLVFRRARVHQHHVRVAVAEAVC
jgi:hypothetical protein